MRVVRCIVLLFMALGSGRRSFASVNPDWTTPIAPFRIADNLFYVGSRDLAAYLVTTPSGNILINANLASSPPQIRASVERLGFKWTDTKILLNSQAHYDHMAGAARVLRETHARDIVMVGDADVIESGGGTDFAAGTDGILLFTPAPVDRVLKDGDMIALGGVMLTAHKTAGHTRGCTTWTMRVHVPGEDAGTLRNVVIVGGMAALSQYRLAGPRASYPVIADDFRRTFLTLEGLRCDIFLGAHGGYFDMLGKLQRMPREGASVWIDPAGYQAAVDHGAVAFENMLREQRQRVGGR